MNAEQKAIIEAAEKEGVPACERDARLVVYSMVKATRAAMAKYEVGLNKMTEKQQDAVHGDLESAYKDLALSIARAMASAGTPAVVMNCSDLKIAKGVFTGTVKADQKYFNELISKVQDKSEVVVVLYERQYADALDGIQSDKDQRALPLDDEPKKPSAKTKERASASTGSATSAAALAKKATELPPKLLEDARAFIDNQQVVTVSGVQNHLKIGALKAESVLEQMEAEGRVKFVGDSKSGEYQKVHTSSKAEKAEASKDPVDKALDDLTFDGDNGSTDVGFDTDAGLTEELYQRIKAHVLKSKKFSVGSILVTIDISDDQIVEQAAVRLEEEGIITAENDAGIREIVQAA